MKRLFEPDIRVAQVYKTGEKMYGVVNKRGRKPLGFSVYVSWDSDGVIFIRQCFLENVTRHYDLDKIYIDEKDLLVVVRGAVTNKYDLR